MHTGNGHGSRDLEARGKDHEARQAAVLSGAIDLLNANGEAAVVGELPTDDEDLGRLLLIARLLSVSPDLDAIERATAQLKPWQRIGQSDAELPSRPEQSGANDTLSSASPPGGVDDRLCAAATAAGDGLLPAELETAGTTAWPAPRRSVLEVTGLDHVALPVSDLDRAVAFYHGVLGLRILNETRTPPPPTTPHVDFAAGYSRVLVYQALGTGEGTPRKTLGGVLQFPHVALRVTEPADLLARLRASGHGFEGPIPSGAGDAAVHLWDPDGNQIDLIIPWQQGEMA